MSNQKKELVMRADAKVKHLQASIAQLKVDAHSSKNDELEKLEKQLTGLTETIKEAGENFTEAVAKKFNSWLK